MSCEYCGSSSNIHPVDAAACAVMDGDLSGIPDASITAEYFRRLRIHKAKLVEAGGKTGGWVKGRPRKVDGKVEGVEGAGVEGVGVEGEAEGDQ